MKRSNALLLGTAFLLGVALAFPAGLMLAGPGEPDPRPKAATRSRHADLPNPYAANFTQDPYFIEQQRKGLESLERSCRVSRQYCREAEQLRQWLEARGAAP